MYFNSSSRAIVVIYRSFYEDEIMKRIVLMIAAACLLTLSAFGQNGREEQKILKVFNEYLEAMRMDQPERDKVRERILTEDYFYMGVDGLPAGKKFVMERQKCNGLKINSPVMSDIKIRLYKDTAILTMRSTGAGVDMGKAWGGDGVENDTRPSWSNKKAFGASLPILSDSILKNKNRC